MKVLSVNTYAGSLLLGARLAGQEIIASYEDEKGYGADIQRLNFGGEFPIRAAPPRRWHENHDSLEGVMVVAHPPCSAFSVQNNAAAKKGTDSDAFKCTTQLLDFAMAKRADAILVESVVGTMEGARHIHDAYAVKHGYRVYRVLLDAVHFGVSQVRKRFWAIFVRNDPADDPAYYVMDFRWAPKIVTVSEVTEWSKLFSDDRPAPDMVKNWTRQVGKWKELGVSDETIDEMLSGKKGYGLLNGKITGLGDFSKYSIHSFRSRSARLLDPSKFANTVLSDSFWLVPGSFLPGVLVGSVKPGGGRLVTIGEMKEFMGFPRNYKFPEKYLASGKFREYLSKGVCPPVAAWLIRELAWNLGHGPEIEAPHAVLSMKPGDVLDLRGSVKEEA